MTLEELEKRQDELAVMWDELQAEFNALKKAQAEEAKPKPPHPRWMPKEKQIYYTVLYSCGKIDMLNWSSEYAAHKDRFRIGNVYKTRAEAEFAAERLKVLAEMREWAGDWNDIYVLVYINSLDAVSFSDVLAYNNSFGEMRFATEKDAENCIKAVGKDRIKKYYFMIPDNEEV